MPQKKRLFLLLFGGIAAVLIACTLNFYSAKAGSIDNPTDCQFQPPAADRSPTMDNIRLIQGGGYNLTWDKTYLGLHRWTTKQWPGVDILVDSTIMFKNGGVVSFSGWDRAGGGNSLIVDGIGPCQGWREFIGHLNYNPTTTYPVGTKIGPDQVIGKPGCSGFEGTCTLTNKKSGTVPPHNHTTLGYKKDVFHFSDGTIPVYVQGYYWIHPARMDSSSAQPVAPKSSETDQSLSQPVEYETGVLQSSVIPTDVSSGNLNDTVHRVLKFLLILIGISFILALLFSADFRRFMLKAVLIMSTLAALMIYLNGRGTFDSGLLSQAKGSFTAAVDKSFIGSLHQPAQAQEQAKTQDTQTQPDGCSISSTYPQSIQQWCDKIDIYSGKYGLDPNLIAAQVWQESGGNPKAISKSGAVGLLQIMPRDGPAASFMCQNGPCFASRPTTAQLEDADFNLNYGIRMLAQMAKKYGSVRDALMHYGPQKVGYYYADKVLAIYNQYK